jgi:hypothetical protein
LASNGKVTLRNQINGVARLNDLYTILVAWPIKDESHKFSNKYHKFFFLKQPCLRAYIFWFLRRGSENKR